MKAEKASCVRHRGVKGVYRALCLAAVGVSGVAASGMVSQVAAQEADGGLLWRFGLAQSIVSETNPGLANPDAATETFARTNLSFALTSTTRSQSFSLEGSGAFDVGDTQPKGFNSPRLRFSYGQEAASSRFNTDLFIRETDVDDLAFEFGVDDFGNPTVTTRPDNGLQRQYGGGLTYEWGRNAPLGTTLTIRRIETDYRDTTDPSLVDSTRDSAALSLRFDLNPTLSLTTRATTSQLDEDGALSTSVTDTLGLTLSMSRPDGSISLSTVVTDTEDGTRTAVSFGRAFELPNGSLLASAGVEESTFGGTGLNAGVDWQLMGSQSNFSLGVQHGISQDSRDDETRRTILNLALDRALLPRLTANVGLSLRDSEQTQTGISTFNGSISAGVSYALTEDWGVSVAASHRIEKEDGLSQTDNTRVSLSIERTFDFLR